MLHLSSAQASSVRRHSIVLLPVLAALCSCGKKPDAVPIVHNSTSKKAFVKAKPQPKAATVAKVHFDRPQYVKGIYLTAWTAGSPNFLAKHIQLIDSTELNAVVIDVRDTGENYFPTHIPLSDSIEGKEFLAVAKPQKMMASLAAHHIWPIARVACFRDNILARKHPERAVQFANGTPWHDRSNHYWLDPYDKDNWDYIAQIVDYAIDIGFPEIQLDYVRFPSEGKSQTQVFPNRKNYPDPKAKPEDVISAFAKFIRDRVKARGDYLSADIFGIISSSKSDQGIGQELEKISTPFDVLSPMVYPSHFHKMEYKIPDPNKAPYEIVYKSLRDYKKRLPHQTIRPWLQAFTLFHVPYGGAEIRAQIKAANDNGYQEFLLWNAANRYTAAGLKTKEESKTSDAVAPTKTPASTPPTVPSNKVKG